MTKDELIARLQVLGEQLNRDVSLTGTKEELVLVWQSWKRSLMTRMTLPVRTHLSARKMR
ncbi:hypothetical protein ECZC10_52070 [Escherichia coli]|nr:hypothetical protein ECZC10_52070 [Escherichia coli]